HGAPEGRCPHRPAPQRRTVGPWGHPRNPRTGARYGSRDDTPRCG
ncbi:hypothetical protein, partial [Agreia sp. Leaf244]